MRLGIKGKQVLGVTSIVGVGGRGAERCSTWRAWRSVSLDESRARAELLANAIYHRAQQVVVAGDEPLPALRADPGLRSILESSLYSKNVMYAALVDVHGVAVAHADRSLEGQPLPPAGDLGAAARARRRWSQLRAIYSSQGQNLEFRSPLLLGDTRDRIDPHRRVDAADSPRSRRVAAPGAADRAGGARRCRCWWRRCCRSCSCGRST